MTLSEYLTAVGDALVDSRTPPEPTTMEEYHAAIERFPDQAWRWKASESNDSLVNPPPEPWTRQQQRRFLDTLRVDGGFRRELMDVLDGTR